MQAASRRLAAQPLVCIPGQKVNLFRTPVILDLEAGVCCKIFYEMVESSELPIVQDPLMHKNVPAVIQQTKCRIRCMLQQTNENQIHVATNERQCFCLVGSGSSGTSLALNATPGDIVVAMIF
jgi:hypothetical protein